jgi:hypothetical protein
LNKYSDLDLQLRTQKEYPVPPTPEDAINDPKDFSPIDDDESSDDEAEAADDELFFRETLDALKVSELDATIFTTCRNAALRKGQEPLFITDGNAASKARAHKVTCNDLHCDVEVKLTHVMAKSAVLKANIKLCGRCNPSDHIKEQNEANAGAPIPVDDDDDGHSTPPPLEHFSSRSD